MAGCIISMQATGIIVTNGTCSFSIRQYQENIKDLSSILHLCVENQCSKPEMTRLPGNSFKHSSFPPLRHKPPSSSTRIYINWFQSHGTSYPLFLRSQHFRQILACLSSLLLFFSRCGRYWFGPSQLIMTRMFCSGNASLNVTLQAEGREHISTAKNLTGAITLKEVYLELLFCTTNRLFVKRWLIQTSCAHNTLVDSSCLWTNLLLGMRAT